MTPDDLRILIQEGESTTLTREMVALANTIGGKILLGVRDDGTVIGMPCARTMIRRFRHRPPVSTTCLEVSIGRWETRSIISACDLIKSWGSFDLGR